VAMATKGDNDNDECGDDVRFDKKWNLDGEGHFRPPSRWQRLWGTSQFRELEKRLTRELKTADAIETELEELDAKGERQDRPDPPCGTCSLQNDSDRSA
jgi:hypothetical protein